MVTFTKSYDFNLRKDHQKIFLWASRLWVGRRKGPILGYIPKNDEKRIWRIKVKQFETVEKRKLIAHCIEWANYLLRVNIALSQILLESKTLNSGRLFWKDLKSLWIERNSSTSKIAKKIPFVTELL